MGDNQGDAQKKKKGKNKAKKQQTHVQQDETQPQFPPLQPQFPPLQPQQPSKPTSTEAVQSVEPPALQALSLGETSSQGKGKKKKGKNFQQVQQTAPIESAPQPVERPASEAQDNPPQSKGNQGRKYVQQTQPPQAQPAQMQYPPAQMQPPQARFPQMQPPRARFPQMQPPPTRFPQMQPPQARFPQMQPPQAQPVQMQPPRPQSAQMQHPQMQAPQAQPPHVQPSMPAQPPRQTKPEVKLAAASPNQERLSPGGSGVLIPKRPKGGQKRGLPIKLDVNYLALDINKSKNLIIHYDVAIDPDKPAKFMFYVIDKFIKQFFPKNCPAFDGVKNLYSSGPLFDGHVFMDRVELAEEDRPGKTRTYEVKLQFAANVDLHKLFRYMESGSSEEPPQSAVQCLDVVLRHTKHQRFVKIGRSFFTPPTGQPVDLGGGLELWYGQFQSAIMGWKPFINIDVAHKGFSKQQSVLDLIRDFEGRDRCVDMNKPLGPEAFNTLKKYLRNLKVVYQIPNQSDSKREFRVSDVTSANPGQIKFQLDNKKTVSILEYFEKEKRYRIQKTNLPCLQTGNKEKKICYPVELCTVKGGQPVMLKMDGNQTTNVIRAAATKADVRKRKIEDIIYQSKFGSDPVAKEFGISVSGKFQEVNGRILQAPQLQYGTPGLVTPRSGQWNPSNFKAASTIERWLVISMDSRTEMSKIQNVIRLIKSEGRGLGMNIADPTTKYSRNRADMLDMLREAEKQKCQFVIVIISPYGNDYAQVKQAAELDVGIVTQCIKSNTVFKFNPNTAKMILQKINSKLDGVNHTLAQISKPQCLSKPCMIVGADVTHPAPGQDNVPSIAAVACSHDPSAFKYNITIRLQPPKTEIITDLRIMIKAQLIFFYQKTNFKPQKIVMFRDGVSEGQFVQVLNAELTAIRAACKDLEDGYRPNITILIVQKRHHTRFFPEDKFCDKNHNAPAGTCVDTTITHPTEMDFYLLSHASIQGTARPTRYHLVWDDSEMSEDEVEHLTYYMCHLYSRCTRAVSYPTPTYYAHWAATRASVLISGTNVNLQDLRASQDKLQIRDKLLRENPMFFV